VNDVHTTIASHNCLSVCIPPPPPLRLPPPFPTRRSSDLTAFRRRDGILVAGCAAAVPRVPVRSDSVMTARPADGMRNPSSSRPRSEEHTSELQSLAYLVCRLLLEKKK